MNTFRHTPDGIIEIDDEQFDLELFLEVEPDYSLPEEYVSRFYDGNHHVLYTHSGQCSGELPWRDGERYLTRVPDLHLVEETLKEEIEYINSLKEDTPKEISCRRAAYPTTNELVIALWEHFVEGKPAEETINILQEKRLKVKEEYPK